MARMTRDVCNPIFVENDESVISCNNGDVMESNTP
jgi:hypothetical protein